MIIADYREPNYQEESGCGKLYGIGCMVAIVLLMIGSLILAVKGAH